MQEGCQMAKGGDTWANGGRKGYRYQAGPGETQHFYILLNTSLTPPKTPAASVAWELSRVSWVVAAGMVSGCRRNWIHTSRFLGCCSPVLKGVTMSFSCHQVLKDEGNLKTVLLKTWHLWFSKGKMVLAAVSLSKLCVKHVALSRRETSDISLSLAFLIVWLWEGLYVACGVWGEFWDDYDSSGNAQVPAAEEWTLCGARRQEVLRVPTSFIEPGFLSYPWVAADPLCTLGLLVLISRRHTVVQR